MSKTSQRRLSSRQERDRLFDQGYRDGMDESAKFRWERHPHLNAYRSGFNLGAKHAQEAEKRVAMWARAAAIVASLLPVAVTREGK